MLWTTRYEKTTGPRPVNKPKPNADLDPTFPTRLGIDLRADPELRDQIKRRPSSPDTDPETRSSLVPPIRQSTARVAGLRPPFPSPPLVLAADGKDLATGATE
ncbi:hypothetical protein U1Q18_012527 [Sarracenia purpurea var. burkii]